MSGVRLERGAELARYRRVRQRSVGIAEPLSPEDMTVQVAVEASPTKWHLAHTTWFFETFVLERFEPVVFGSFEAYDPVFRVLFNSYYRGVGERHPRGDRGLLTRPGVGEVLAYRDTVDERVVRVVEKLSGAELDEALALVELGLQHEEQHQELMLTDIKRTLFASPIRPAYWGEKSWGGDAAEGGCAGSSEVGAASWVGFEGGVVEIGFDPGVHGEVFAYDNEGPRHRVFLEPFEVMDRVVTNGEFLAFVEDGGYERPELWLDLGWTARERGGWEMPMYWSRGENAAWGEYTFRGVEALDADGALGYVSFFEADAYARWAGARLATEAEWEHACAGGAGGVVDEGAFVEGSGLVARVCGGGDSGGRVRGGMGGVWEWTRSSHEPYPGYAPPAGAIGEYNGKFMCNQYVLRGGSCLTSAAHIRGTYRNFFEPEARWQCAGVRLARSMSR